MTGSLQLLILAFLCDITEHMSALNLQLQGKDQHIGILWQRVSAFRSKLQLLKTQLSEGSCPHFKTLEGRVNAGIHVDLSQYICRNFIRSPAEVSTEIPTI